MIGLKVLICDDNKVAREILVELLTSFSFNVTSVNSGYEALEALKREKDEPFELLLIDWNMPGLNGLETTERIINELNIHELPIIIMVTAYYKEEIFSKAMSLGIKGLLTKPVNSSILFDAIMNAFGKSIKRKTSTSIKTDQFANDLKSLRGSYILLCEDNLINQEIACELLEKAGFIVDIANNGEEGVEMVFNSGTPSKYSLILMDLQMPVLDGFDETRKIKESKQFDNIPIIAMTADAMIGVKDMCIKAGMVDYISKPINPNEIFNTLIKWMKTSKLHINKYFEDTDNNESFIELPDLVSINTEDGLMRVSDNRKLYLKILKSYYESYVNFEQDFLNGLKNDRSIAIRLAHTLKGVSGSIGAEHIMQLAENLEVAVKQENQDSINSELAILIEKLNIIMDELNQKIIKKDSVEIDFQEESYKPNKDNHCCPIKTAT